MSPADDRDVLGRARKLSRIEPGPESTRRAMARAREALSASPPSGHRRLFGWIVLPTGIAAGLLILVGIALFGLPGKPAGAAEMLQAVARASEAYKGWIHVKGEIERPASAAAAGVPLSEGHAASQPTTQQASCAANAGPSSIEGYFNARDLTEITVFVAGRDRRIRWFSPPRRESIEYDSRTNEIWIGDLHPGVAKSLAKNQPTLESVLAAVREAKQKPDIQVDHKREGSLDRFDLVYPKSLLDDPKAFPCGRLETVWVDPSTHLIQQTAGLAFGGHMTMSWAYGGPGVKEIYDLGVPRDTKVVDGRLRGPDRKAETLQLDDLVNELARRYKAGYGDHTAMVIQSHVSDDGALDPWFIHLMRRRGSLERTDSFYVGQSKEYGDLRRQVQSSWPTLPMSRMLELEPQATVYERYIMTDKGGMKDGNDGIGRVRLPAQGALGTYTSTMSSLAWINVDILKFTSPGETRQMSLLPRGEHPAGWIGLRVLSQGRTHEGKQTKWTDEYWFDTAKDYVLMERTTDGDRSGQSKTWMSKRLTAEVAHTEAGAWFPARIKTDLKIEIITPKGKSKIVESDQEQRIVLDPRLVPEERLFSLTGQTVSKSPDAK